MIASGPVSTATDGRQATRVWPLVSLALVAGGIVLAPLSLRLLNAAVVGTLPERGYLPSLELRRERKPFRTDVIDELRYGNPRWVFIGDSMLGTRIDPIHLGRLSTSGDENISFLYHAATGPAWWYLAFKNHLVASGIRPRVVFFFFRDTNLTDTMFRLEGLYGGVLDEVAHDAEPELDAMVAARRRGFWARVHAGVAGTYQNDVATSWLTPAVRRWYVDQRYHTPPERAQFEWTVEQTFGLDHLRSDIGSDLAAAERPDFDRDVSTSVLPLIADLARAHGLTVCFVRVQRRPEQGRAPADTPELAAYVAKLRAWTSANAALFHDDTGDPEMTLALYGDGDHVADRQRYSEIFRRRLDPLFR